LCDKPTEESSDSLINVDEQDDADNNYQDEDDDLGLVTKEVHFDDCEPIQDENTQQDHHLGIEVANNS